MGCIHYSNISCFKVMGYIPHGFTIQTFISLNPPPGVLNIRAGLYQCFVFLEGGTSIHKLACNMLCKNFTKRGIWQQPCARGQGGWMGSVLVVLRWKSLGRVLLSFAYNYINEDFYIPHDVLVSSRYRGPGGACGSKSAYLIWCEMKTMM